MLYSFWYYWLSSNDTFHSDLLRYIFKGYNGVSSEECGSQLLSISPNNSTGCKQHNYKDVNSRASDPSYYHFIPSEAISA